ncbi:MAG: PspC domain-containing protein [Flavobacteriales bacterium]|nr:PspC domain-containing protein [Flavobacteriales bacterium]
MKPTIDINLGGMLFHLDDDAYKALQSYLKALDKHLQTVDGRQEILSDIESRIAELLTERLASTRQVVSMLDVDAVKETLGSPSEFGPGPVDEPSQGYSEPHDPSARSKRPYRRLYRDDQDRVVGGVASGIAAFFNWDPLVLRVLFLLLLFTGGGVLLYIILWVLMPKAVTTAERLAMRGEPVTVETIRNKVETEFDKVKNSMDDMDVKGRFSRGARRTSSVLGRILRACARIVIGFVSVALLVTAIAIGTVALNFLIGDGSVISESGKLSELSEVIMPAGYSMTYLWIMTILVLSGPIIFIILLNLRAFFGMRYNRPSSRMLGGLGALATLIGLLMAMVSGIKVATEFSVDASHLQTVNMPESVKTWELSMADIMLKDPDFSLGRVRIDGENLDEWDESDLNDSFPSWWYIKDNRAFFNNVEVDVRPARQGQASLTVRRYASGSSRREASYRANRIDYDLTVSDSGEIVVNNMLDFPTSDRQRGQSVEVVLYLPVGHRVSFDVSLENYLYDVDNVANMYDDEMLGRTWIMMPEGLTEVKAY